MAVAFLIELLIIAFLLLLAATLISKVLPLKVKRVPHVIAGLLILWHTYNSGILGDFKQTPPETLATLLEQARGDQLHWNQFGKPATRWEGRSYRNYEQTCQIYALEKIAELGPAAHTAVPDLIDIFNQHEDHNTGDGVLHVQTTAGKSLGMIGHPDAIAPLMAMLRKKALSPDPDNSGKIQWHDREYERADRSYLKRGTGPQGIMMALMLMPRKYHAEIAQQLNNVYAEIQQAELFNDWAKFEISRALGFFEADKAAQREVQYNLQEGWYIDDANFEALISRDREPRSTKAGKIKRALSRAGKK